MNNYNQKSGIVKSMFSALSPSRLSLKLLWMFVVITLFSIKELIYNLNLYSNGELNIFLVFWNSYSHGTSIIYSSIWDFFTTYILNWGVDIPTGDLIFGIFFVLGGLMITYQISSIIVDIFDYDIGDIGSPILKLLLALVLLLLIAALFNITGSESYIAQNVINQTINEAINQTLTNTTNQTVVTINLN